MIPIKAFCVSWTEVGDKFIVQDQARLSAECIPLYLSHISVWKMFPSVKLEPGNGIVPFAFDILSWDHPEWLPDINDNKWGTKLSRSSVEQEQIIEDIKEITRKDKSLTAGISLSEDPKTLNAPRIYQ
jgi:hypothetical protein